jgi:PGF-CTERM protein
VVTAALVGAVATTTAQSTDQPRLTADRHVVRGQTVALDLARVLDDRPEESFELRRVSQNGSVGATVAAFDAADGGSATLDTGAFDPGRYVVTYGRTAAVRFDDGTGTVVGAATNESAVERADFRVVTAENASVTLPDDPISLADGTALVTADTTLLPGTELTIRARSDADARSPFVQSTAPTVGPDGSVTTTFDTPANASTAVQVTVLYEDTTLAETTAPLGQRASPTASPTSATTGDTTTRPPDTRTTVPGFGAAVAVLAVLGAGLLAGRR